MTNFIAVSAVVGLTNLLSVVARDVAAAASTRRVPSIVTRCGATAAQLALPMLRLPAWGRLPTMLATLLWASGCAAGASANPHSVNKGAASRTPPCSVATLSQTGLTFPDGRVAFIHVQGLASAGRQIAIVGSPVLALNPRGLSKSDPPRTDSLLGAIVQDGRIVALIPNPIDGRPVRDVRIAAGPSQDWHLLFVELLGDTSSTVVADSVRIWYGRFDGEQWHDVSVASKAFSAKVNADLSTALITRGAELAFAYAFDQSRLRQSNARGNQGVVLLTRRSGIWRADTLHTVIGPNYVAMIAPPQGPIRVGIVQAYFDASGRLHGSSLFEAAYGTSWAIPRLVAGAGVATVRRPRVVASGDIVLTWQIAGTRPRLEWTALETSADSELPIRSTELSPYALDFDVVGLKDVGLVWLVPSVAEPDRITVLVRHEDRVHTGGTIQAPNTGLSFRAVALDSTIALTSAKVTLSTEVAPAQTYLTILAVSCHG